jgi:hypothetical protein
VRYCITACQTRHPQSIPVFVARQNVAGNKGIIDLGNGATVRAGFLVTPEYGDDHHRASSYACPRC